MIHAVWCAAKESRVMRCNHAMNEVACSVEMIL